MGNAYQSRLMPALTGLPMISLVFSGEITRTERATSMELIGFGNGNIHEACGMAQYGGYVTNFAKQSMRLYFRDQYGTSKLKYPLFAGFDHDLPAVDEFDALDLRQCSHDMVERGYYLSGTFCDDSLLDMGHLNPHGRFIHIMVNGQGYPQRHFERGVHSASKLVHVCDVYDALRTTRPYREAWGSDRVLEHIEKGAGPDFDLDAATGFCAMMRQWEQKEAGV